MVEVLTYLTRGVGIVILALVFKLLSLLSVSQLSWYMVPKFMVTKSMVVMHANVGFGVSLSHVHRRWTQSPGEISSLEKV